MDNPNTRLIIRRPCRHDQGLPHSVVVLGLGDPLPNRWCTDGDTKSFDRPEMVALFYDVLATQDLRVEKDLAASKARQLVIELFDNLLREQRSVDA